ncbi:MAG: SRPBCC domain-containing protein [Pseudomonadota bacterium]
MQILKTFELPLPPEQVYAAWVSSDTVIPPATAMDIDPRVGGHYRLIIETPEFSSRNDGTFLELKPGVHVRYSWQWQGDDEQTIIDVRFEPLEDGQATRIVLEHSGFAREESHAQHEQGWDAYFAGLRAFLVG